MQISYSVLTWWEAPRLLATFHSDVGFPVLIQVFDPSLIPALVKVFWLALQPSQRSANKMAVIALTLRNEDTFKQFTVSAGEFFVVA